MGDWGWEKELQTESSISEQVEKDKMWKGRMWKLSPLSSHSYITKKGFMFPCTDEHSALMIAL